MLYLNKIVLIIITFAILLSCSNDENNNHYDIIYLEENTNQVDGFDEYFNNQTDIDLYSGNESEEIAIPVIYALEVNSQGNIAIPNHSNNTIALFDSLGQQINVIGEGEGRGPGEFEGITSFKFDGNDNLWVYDPGLMRISLFSPPQYEFSQVLDVEFYFSDMIVDENNNLILYTYNHENNMVVKLDSNGDIVESVIEPENESLKIFLNRFQGGGLRKGFERESFFAVYPAEFGIYKIGMDLEIQSKITSRESNISKYRPTPPSFPSRLDPYDYTEAHASWWYSFFHLSKLFTVEPNFLILSLYEQTGSQEYTFYLNIYDVEGSVIVEGLPLPTETRVVGSWKNKVFFVRDEQMLADGTIQPRRLTFYEIKDHESGY